MQCDAKWYLDVQFACSLLLSFPGLDPFHGPCDGIMLLGALILLDLQSWHAKNDLTHSASRLLMSESDSDAELSPSTNLQFMSDSDSADQLCGDSDSEFG